LRRETFGPGRAGTPPLAPTLVSNDEELRRYLRMLEQWELYWTPPHIKKVIDAALEYGVALEISFHCDPPKLPFLKLAKAVGGSGL
jgi:hypothetical protein